LGRLGTRFIEPPGPFRLFGPVKGVPPSVRSDHRAPDAKQFAGYRALDTALLAYVDGPAFPFATAFATRRRIAKFENMATILHGKVDLMDFFHCPVEPRGCLHPGGGHDFLTGLGVDNPMPFHAALNASPEQVLCSRHDGASCFAFGATSARGIYAPRVTLWRDCPEYPK